MAESPSNEPVLAVIPARLKSTRLPQKMMREIRGKSLIQYTYENAKKIRGIDRLVIATDDRAISDHVSPFAEVVMTDPNCLSGTDRIAEMIEKDPKWRGFPIVLNIQGDEPLLPPSTAEKLIAFLRSRPDVKMATAICPMDENWAGRNNLVKCVKAQDGRALYFSRSQIPGHKENSSERGPFYQHIGIYGFRRDFLLHFAKLEPTPLQLTESLEQLKALEHGYSIYTVEVDHYHPGIDTLDDVQTFENYLCQQNTSS